MTRGAVLKRLITHQNQVARVTSKWTGMNPKWSLTRNAARMSSSSAGAVEGERLRVAVIGGGVSGLSTALHLAPLVKAGYLAGPIDVFDAPTNPHGRDIGVGVWSTALDPFRDSGQEIQEDLYQKLTQQGIFIRDVGYRSPKGHWLATSSLDGGLPDLLFLKENVLLAELRSAAIKEEKSGSIKLHQGFPIHSIDEDSPSPWSAKVFFEDPNKDEGVIASANDYHLIVAADGMNSVIRRNYGGYVYTRRKNTAPGSSPLDLADPTSDDKNWSISSQAEATGVQDRQYTVFRGNSPLSMEDVGSDKSFQTWGEGKSMRFAVVPLPAEKADGTIGEQQVWFITIDDETIINEEDPIKRRAKLLEAFQDWHDPIGRLVESTPADEILVERAMAHKHSMTPVTNFNEIVSQRNQLPNAKTGNGPAIVFVGDAFMTVDPILAQGFTIGMEGAANLKDALEVSLRSNPQQMTTRFAFCPYVLRKSLKSRHDSRVSRLIHLLQVTELVQSLGQPNSGTFMGWLSRDLLRPMMKIAPDFVKTPIFNFMLLYSLGLTATKNH